MGLPMKYMSVPVSGYSPNADHTYHALIVPVTWQIMLVWRSLSYHSHHSLVFLKEQWCTSFLLAILNTVTNTSWYGMVPILGWPFEWDQVCLRSWINKLLVNQVHCQPCSVGCMNIQCTVIDNVTNSMGLEEYCMDHLLNEKRMCQAQKQKTA